MARKPQPTKSKDVVNDIIPKRHRLKCKNQKQKAFSNLITDKEIIIATGPAGVGKSYVAIARAIELVQNTSNQYRKIILINPAVEAEEKHGFIPGTMREKLEPFVGSSLDIVDKILSKTTRLKLEDSEILIVGALGHIRGKSIDNTILIMEEAQNASPKQMKTLLTRIGYNSKFIISGDLDQSDRYNDFRRSGLYDVNTKHRNIPEFGFVEFTQDEIVRNPLITTILDNYKKDVNINIPEPPKDREIKSGLDLRINKKKKSNVLKWLKANFKW